MNPRKHELWEKGVRFMDSSFKGEFILVCNLRGGTNSPSSALPLKLTSVSVRTSVTPSPQ